MTIIAPIPSSATAPDALARRTREDGKPSIPKPLPFADDLVVVDTTWGRIQPIRLADGVETVGELEVLEHLRAGLPLIDTRSAASFAAATIPGARHLPHDEIAERLDELDPSTPAVLFCNGPQCPATPNAIRALLTAGVPPQTLKWYRGGMHDWITLGLPITAGSGIG